MTNHSNTLNTSTQTPQRRELWSAVRNNDASYNNQDNLLQSSANVTNFTNSLSIIPQDHHTHSWRKDERIDANRVDLNGCWQSSTSTNVFLHQQHSSYNGQQHPFFNQQCSSYDCHHSFYDQHYLQYEQQQYSSPSMSITSSPASSTSSAASSTTNYVWQNKFGLPPLNSLHFTTPVNDNCVSNKNIVKE